MSRLRPRSTPLPLVALDDLSVVGESSVLLRRGLSQEGVAVLPLRAGRSVVCEEGCLLSGVRRS